MADQEGSVAVITSPVEGEVGGSKIERLPAELIQPIFDLLHNPETAHQSDLIRPISKHVLPYSTATLYRRIKITTFDDLSQLCVSTSDKATLGPLIQELQCGVYGQTALIDATLKSLLSRLVEGLLCTSLINLKTLTVRGWDLVGEVLLSKRFGNEGGRALEKIEMSMIFCFESIEGNITTAWSHLQHLPVLASIEYHNTGPFNEAEAGIPPKLGGFEKLSKVRCYLLDFSSSHATSFASLFTSALQQIELVHTNVEVRPNYSPFLDSLPPESITSIQLFTGNNIVSTAIDQYPIYQSLTRFPRLQHLVFYDDRIFDSELIEAIQQLNLTTLEIFHNSKLSYDLMHQLLSGIKKKSWKNVEIGVDMAIGTTGIKYRDGVKTVVDDAGNLIPGEGWKRPDWSIITLPEARELERISIKRGIELDGEIKWGLEVERKFEEEEKWLNWVMKVMRTGPVDCTDCGKKN